MKRTRETLARRWSQVASRVSVRALSMIASRRRRRTLVVVAGVGCVPSRASSRRSGDPSARSCRPNVTAWAPRADIAPPSAVSPLSRSAGLALAAYGARRAYLAGIDAGAAAASAAAAAASNETRDDDDDDECGDAPDAPDASSSRRPVADADAAVPLALARARHPSRRPASHHLASHHLASRRPSP